MNKTYLLSVAIFFVPLAGLFGLNYLYLRNIGEFLSVQEIIELQQTNPGFCIYGTALHDDTTPYKLAGIAAKKPDITVIGSSLTLQYRGRYFAQPFFSMSGTMDHPVTGELLLPMFLAAHTPKVLLMGVDVWWFQQDVNPYRRARLEWPDSQRFSLEKVSRPFVWLFEGKVSPGEYLRTALFGQSESAPCAIGVFARQKRRGFGPDGSYYYTSVMEGKDTEGASPKFTLELDDIREDRGHYVHGTTVRPESMQEFLGMIKLLEDAGVTVVPFFAPFAPRVYEEIQKHADDYVYIAALKKELREKGITVFDFFNPQSIGASDCEFIDGAHMGDVASARLLKALYNSSKDPLVRSLINIQEIDATIKNSAGFAMSKDPRVTDVPETDFLQLGCPKMKR